MPIEVVVLMAAAIVQQQGQWYGLVSMECSSAFRVNGVISVLSGRNYKALRRTPALDALKPRTGFQGFDVLGLLFCSRQAIRFRVLTFLNKLARTKGATTKPMEDTAVQAGDNLRYLLVALGVIGGGGLALWLQRDKKAAKRPKQKQFVPKNTKGFQ